jgi:hypothetical protein
VDRAQGMKAIPQLPLQFASQVLPNYICRRLTICRDEARGEAEHWSTDLCYDFRPITELVIFTSGRRLPVSEGRI